MPGFRLVLLVLLLAGCRVPVAEASKPFAHTVLRPVANLHSGPGVERSVVSQALYGARLQELERRDGWVKVRGEDDYTGWIEAAALRALGPQEDYPADPARAVEVDVLGANVFRVADVTKQAPVLTLPFGARLERTLGVKDNARWFEVRLADASLAWIQAGDLRADARTFTIEESLALARRFLGVTYTWGGTSSFGFDCSGFTQAIVRRRGVLMPRDSVQQVAWGGLAEVTRREDLRPGDLLFFGRDLARVNHTGMYLGDGKFIHDTPKGRPGVQISELSEPDWSKALVAMRRVK